MSTNSYPKLFDGALLPASTPSTFYTVPTTLPTTVTLQDLQLKFTNTDSNAHTVTAYAVPNGGSASTSNAVCVALSIPANDYVIVPVQRVDRGGTIQAFADVVDVVNIAPIGGKLHTP